MHLRVSKTEQAKRLEHCCVHLLANDYFDRRRAEQAVLLKIPAFFAQEVVTRGREGGDIRHLRAGHKRSARRRGQIKQIKQPTQHNIFEVRRHRREIEQARILVPGAGKPVRRDRRGEGSADDATEHARSHACHRGRRTDLVEQFYNRTGILPICRHGTTQRW
jgi:hypothetical protein